MRRTHTYLSPSPPPKKTNSVIPITINRVDRQETAIRRETDIEWSIFQNLYSYACMMPIWCFGHFNTFQTNINTVICWCVSYFSGMFPQWSVLIWMKFEYNTICMKAIPKALLISTVVFCIGVIWSLFLFAFESYFT